MTDPLATLRTALEKAREASAAVADATSRDFIKAEKAEAAAWSAVSAALKGVEREREGVRDTIAYARECVLHIQPVGDTAILRERALAALQGTPHAD